MPIEMKCPVCELRCVARINNDALECPEHGEMTGFQIVRLGSLRGYEALIELMYWRAKQESARIWAAEYDRVFGNNYDRILHGYAH